MSFIRVTYEHWDWDGTMVHDTLREAREWVEDQYQHDLEVDRKYKRKYSRNVPKHRPIIRIIRVSLPFGWTLTLENEI